MSIETVSVYKLSEFLEQVLERIAVRRRGATFASTSGEAETEIWFRGQSRSSYALVPAAYRSNRDCESMFNRFVAGSAGTFNPTPKSPWEWYFAAQHYELPTRLLDWTEDPLCAAYFAVRGMLSDDAPLETRNIDDPPAVWMMDAGSLNHISYNVDEVFVPIEDGPWTKYWLPGNVSPDAPTGFKYEGQIFTNNSPIAIWPTRSTPRIIAQNGCFTVHGASRESIDAIFDSSQSYHGSQLTKLRLCDYERIDRELSDVGVTRLRLFPEPQNVASRLRRLYPSEPHRSTKQASSPSRGCCDEIGRDDFLPQ